MEKDVTIDIHVIEDDTTTSVKAVLDLRGDHFEAIGTARRNPIDEPAPLIGEELAIARMLLKDPAIVVLDEATSHLDSENEALVQAALATALEGRTAIVIAHRLSTITAADEILVLDQGRIVERGTHRELLDAGGLYNELYTTLVRGEPTPA